MLRILPGTHISFLTSLPSRNLLTFSTAFAAMIAVSLSASFGISICPRTLPFTWTPMVMLSSTNTVSSTCGHGSYVSDSVWPIRNHISSATCGAYGAKRIAKGSSAPRGFVSHLLAALMNSIMAAIAVLNLNSSVSVVTLLMHMLRALSCSFVGSVSTTPSPIVLHTRAKKRCTPSIARVDHVLVSLSGPINISYKRSESAPNSSTISSGLITLPRLLLILYARESTLTVGSPFKTHPALVVSTSVDLSFLAVTPGEPAACGLTNAPVSST
mmetsp:Transcript_13574/g.49358  ORF Transcript_13574/g.49358 Transcript_13574/m.49358 type:complete len:271 (+) Transcript_13574:666-1478(+)